MHSFRTALICVMCSFGPLTLAAADPVTIPVSVSTSGVFSCFVVAPCIASGGNAVTIPSGGGSATVTFTGVNETFGVTNTSSQVVLGRFDVVATPGYTWPVAAINPVLSIFAFRLDVENPVTGSTARLFWDFGPGGGLALNQRGFWDFGLPPDVPSPWPAVNFTTNAPLLVVNQSTDLTAQAGLVPEPTTMLLVGSGLFGLMRCRRRRDVV
jgi:hypothetical protein